MMTAQQQLFAATDLAPVVTRNAEVIDLRDAFRARALAAWADRLAGVLTADQVAAVRAAVAGRKLAFCFGGGVDSTAMFILLFAAGLFPDVITFADTGGEKPGTLEHVSRMNALLPEWGYPEIVTVRHRTLAATEYSDLEGNCTNNETLPSLAFGLHSCSIKWKQEPQDQHLKGCHSGPNKRPPHPLWLEAQAAGERIVKLIGYDAGNADIRRSKKLNGADEDFDYIYLLQIVGWKRHDCVRVIAQVLGPDYVPIKSACFYCPASKLWELYWLAGHHPDLFERALAMEYGALTGRHSRFDAEEYGATWEELVRRNAPWPPRKKKKKEKGEKERNSTIGLGRSFSWCHWARINDVVDEDFHVKREQCARFIEMADQMLKEDNAFDARACA